MVVPFWLNKYLKQAIATGCYSIHLDSRIINKKIINAVKKHNIKIAVYTVNCPKLANELLGQGVDAVFSDHADLDSLAVQFRKKGDRLGDLIHMIINSRIFISK